MIKSFPLKNNRHVCESASEENINFIYVWNINDNAYGTQSVYVVRHHPILMNLSQNSLRINKLEKVVNISHNISKDPNLSLLFCLNIFVD